MKIVVKAELQQTRSGVEARSPEIALTSYGLDEREAMESLRRGILAWCEGLRAVQKFDNVLKTRHLKCETGGEGLLVEIKGEWLAPTQRVKASVAHAI